GSTLAVQSRVCVRAKVLDRGPRSLQRSPAASLAYSHRLKRRFGYRIEIVPRLTGTPVNVTAWAPAVAEIRLSFNDDELDLLLPPHPALHAIATPMAAVISRRRPRPRSGVADNSSSHATISAIGSDAPPEIGPITFAETMVAASAECPPAAATVR